MRSKYEIVKEILSATEEEAIKTSIVYDANLGFQQADEYLERMCENGLLEKGEDRKVKYHITRKGREVLDLLKRLETRMEL